MTAYYNENDPFAAEWLRQLIRARRIAPGDVDERSIVDVSADDLSGYTQCHFFAGVAGWSLALRVAGWPDDKECWTGSCPCQPLSIAGQQKGHADERHLWPAFHRLIAECSPAIIFGEQVASKDGREWLAAVRADLEDGRYAIGAADLCAASVGAPHIRQRLFFAAKRLDHAASARCLGQIEKAEREARDEARLRLSGAGSTTRRLANSIGTRLERRDEGTMGHECEAVERGGSTSGMADAHRGERDGFAELRGVECDGEDAGWEEGGGQPGARGDDGGLADSTAGGRGEERPDDQGQLGGDSAEGFAAGSCASVSHGRTYPPNGFWRGPDWIYCRDGKWRPVESTLRGLPARVPEGMVRGSAERCAAYPLAEGKIEARAQRLKGYGNAINPFVAAEFIKATGL